MDCRYEGGIVIQITREQYEWYERLVGLAFDLVNEAPADEWEFSGLEPQLRAIDDHLDERRTPTTGGDDGRE